MTQLHVRLFACIGDASFWKHDAKIARMAAVVEATRQTSQNKSCKKCHELNIWLQVLAVVTVVATLWLFFFWTGDVSLAYLANKKQIQNIAVVLFCPQPDSKLYIRRQSLSLKIELLSPYPGDRTFVLRNLYHLSKKLSHAEPWFKFLITLITVLMVYWNSMQSHF